MTSIVDRRAISVIPTFLLVILLVLHSPTELSALSRARQPPRLFVLAVGINDYTGPTPNLAFATNDALAIADIFRTQEGKLYREVHTRVLLDGNATRESILLELNRFIGRARADDVAIVFLAGHGVQTRGTYYFLGHGADIHNPSLQGISGDALARHIAWADARKTITILDTSHSPVLPGIRGFRVAPRMSDVIQQLAEAEGSIVISATSEGEEAMEGTSGHGALTFAIREALLEGRARTGENRGVIDVATLFNYVSARVRELTNGFQNPSITGMRQSFPVYVID